MKLPGTDLAPVGYIWVCTACGKTSRTKYGFDKANRRTAIPGWDESCMMNAALFLEGGVKCDRLTGLVTEIIAEPVEVEG